MFNVSYKTTMSSASYISNLFVYLILGLYLILYTT